MSGLKINPGMIRMQHQSSLLTQMMNGGSALPTIMGAGSARTQAMALTRQFDTFERLSDMGYTASNGYGAYSASGTGRAETDENTASGTAHEQAKELMKDFDASSYQTGKSAAAAQTAGTAEKAAEAGEASKAAE